MKNLTEYINDSLDINESLLGTAAAVAGGILGFKILRTVIRSLAQVAADQLNAERLDKLPKLLDDIESRLTKLLERNPEAYEYANKNMTKNAKGQLSGLAGSYEMQDDEKFRALIKDEDKQELDDIIHEAIKLRNEYAKKLSKVMFGDAFGK